MTTDFAADPIENPLTNRPAPGMTTKVIKGSFWTLLGLVIPVAAAFVATPIVIRLLGDESYGVFILVLLIPNYFSFADFGMNIASTKFGSEAHAHGSPDEEARVVRTAALIALLTSLPFAAAIAILAGPIIRLFNVPERLYTQSTLALRIAAIIFVLNFLNNILNTPQLTRLRMDLNTGVTAGVRVAGIIATPIVLFLGGGILGAVIVALVVSVLTLIGHVLISRLLLREIIGISIDRNLLRPMVKFGASLVIAGVAAALLVNLEKFVLTSATSVATLAYYSVSATFAAMVTLMSGSIVQSLMPAFSQLQRSNDRAALSLLYSRGICVAAISVVPATVFLALIAKPFFTLWAGPDFGRESPLPFYIILSGLAFNVLAFFPWATLMAAGRSDIFAKLYWIELIIYIPLVGWSAVRFGAGGVATVWCLRVIADAFVLFRLAKKVGGVSFVRRHPLSFAPAAAVMLVPLAALAYFGEINLTIAILFVISTVAYAFIVWRSVLEYEETVWLWRKISGSLGMVRALFNG